MFSTVIKKDAPTSPTSAINCPLPSTDLYDQRREERLATVLRATEYLFLENIALKLILEYREVPNWQRVLDHLLSDKEMLAGVRLKFSDLYREIEASADPSSALADFLGGLPAPKKTH